MPLTIQCKGQLLHLSNKQYYNPFRETSSKRVFVWNICKENASKNTSWLHRKKYSRTI